MKDNVKKSDISIRIQAALDKAISKLITEEKSRDGF